jgi:GAF domain-containing protein
MKMPDPRYAETFVLLADTTSDTFDLVDFLHGLTARCVELLDVSASGLFLARPGGGLFLAASSSSQSRLVELFKLQVEEGPCLECYHSGKQVVEVDLPSATGRWPRFAPATVAGGYRAVQALPMRRRDEILGTLSLFHSSPGPFPADQVHLAQAFADVATIGLLQERAVHDLKVISAQLQSALDSRVAIERAAGIVAGRFGLDIDAAFDRIRRHARDERRRLSDLAQDIVVGSFDVTSFAERNPEDRSHTPSGLS